MYLIDSDVLIDVRDNLATAREFVAQLTPAGVRMSIISYIEVYQGLLRWPDPAERDAAIRAMVAAIPLLNLTEDIARRCAEIREHLRMQGRQVRSRAFDVIIAATALEHGLTLVTRNTDDYRDIPGLKLQAVT